MEKSLENLNELSIVDKILKQYSLENLKPSQFSPLTLAFIGDCIFDLIIRTVIIEHGNAPVNTLHKHVAHYVKAPSQMEMYHLVEKDLSEEEIQVYKRGRNAKSYTSAKNATITEYRSATGFEALIGYLYLNKQFDRALEILHTAMKRFDEQQYKKRKEQ